MPLPKRYPLGWRVTIKKGGKKIRRRFQADRCGGDEQAYAAACQFIRITLSEKQAAKKKLDELPQVIAKYHEWSEKVRRKSPETMRKQHQALGIFSRFCKGRNITTLGNIDTALCLNFQQWFFENAPFNRVRRRDNYNPSANWHKYHQFLNAFLNWSMRRGYIEDNPARHPDFKPKVQDKVPTIFNHEELRLLFSYFDQQDINKSVKHKTSHIIPHLASHFLPTSLGKFFRLLLYTGMRPGEAMKLKWADINLRSGVIQVTGQTKTKTVRSIPMHREVRKLLKSMPTRKNVYVFDSGRNEPLGDDQFYYRELRRACVIMKIKPHRVYDFRHTFAANLVIGGVHIGAVKELLGHARVEQTLVYIHFAPQHLKSAVDSLKF